MDKILKYGITDIEIFEDNGGLTFAVWRGDERLCSSEFECSEGFLAEILKDLQHETPHNWANIERND